jgi:hypothetical protein
MNTKSIKTSELIGEALDYAVLLCVDQEINVHKAHYCPSTNWQQGGEIIEREIKTLEREHGGWFARSQQGYTETGKTPLIAAMRCYVASKLGDSVEIPSELTV